MNAVRWIVFIPAGLLCGFLGLALFVFSTRAFIDSHLIDALDNTVHNFNGYWFSGVPFVVFASAAFVGFSMIGAAYVAPHNRIVAASVVLGMIGLAVLVVIALWIMVAIRLSPEDFGYPTIGTAVRLVCEAVGVIGGGAIGVEVAKELDQKQRPSQADIPSTPKP